MRQENRIRLLRRFSVSDVLVLTLIELKTVKKIDSEEIPGVVHSSVEISSRLLLDQRWFVPIEFLFGIAENVTRQLISEHLFGQQLLFALFVIFGSGDFLQSILTISTVKPS